MYRTIFLVTVLCYPASPVLATTGWDRHDAQVAAFRIHGENCMSFVHRIDVNDAALEPALCSNLDANGEQIGLACPPDYAVRKTHLAIRYPIVVTTNAPPNHFLIRIEDGQVTGPLTEAEFKQSPVVSQADLEWKTPLTATDRLNRFAVVLLTCVSLSVLGMAVLLFGTVTAMITRSRKDRLPPTAHKRSGLVHPDA